LQLMTHATKVGESQRTPHFYTNLYKSL